MSTPPFSAAPSPRTASANTPWPPPLTVLTLAACLWLNSRWQQYGAFRAAVLDVGQGESVALCSGSEAALVDCGSSNSYVDAGSVAPDALQSAGIRRLSAVIVTHYHADHTNGLTEVLTRLPVDTLFTCRTSRMNTVSATVSYPWRRIRARTWCLSPNPPASPWERLSSPSTRPC